MKIIKKIFQNIESVFIWLVKVSIRFYQVFLTRFLGSYNCRFSPSCSQYFIEAVEKKGLFIGCYLGVKRILKCQPFSSKSGFDPLK
jgi:hypothetical protein